MSVSWWVWIVFFLSVVAVLLLDLAVFHRRAQEVTLREAAAWTVVWLVLAVGFAAIVWAWLGGAAAKEYLAGYLIERSLSVDNVFVLVVIFAYFAVPPEYRHRAAPVGRDRARSGYGSSSSASEPSRSRGSPGPCTCSVRFSS